MVGRFSRLEAIILSKTFQQPTGQLVFQQITMPVFPKSQPPTGGIGIGITVFPTFRVFQKHPLLVNMAVVINKHKIHEKSIDLLKENL